MDMQRESAISKADVGRGGGVSGWHRELVYLLWDLK
jgi:hypothetical protein